MRTLDEKILDAVLPGWKYKNQMPTPNFVYKIKIAVKEVKHLACYEDKQLGGYIDLDIGEVNDRITNLENQLGEKS